jgi:large subunit ribosomal protein L22
MAKIVLAKSKYIDRTSRKVRLVVDLIRGKKALEALDIVKFSNKAAGEPVFKTVKSAIANASNNFGMDKKDLVIVQAFVDDAPVFKRGKAVSRGRYHQILRRNCHITIGVSDNKVEDVKEVKVKSEVKKEEVAKEAPKKVAKKPINKTNKK